MATITEFESWLDQVGLEDHDEVYCLYRSVLDCSDSSPSEWGQFKCIKNPKGKKFVTADNVDDTLMIASEDAEKHFFEIIRKHHCEDLTIEGWYAYCKEMEKND